MNKKYEAQKQIRLHNKIKQMMREQEKEILKTQNEIDLLQAKRLIMEVIEENNLSEGDEWKNA